MPLEIERQLALKDRSVRSGDSHWVIEAQKKEDKNEKKCPRFEGTWTLFDIRYPVLATIHFSANLHMRWPKRS
jgi:hypothetical protein